MEPAGQDAVLPRPQPVCIPHIALSGWNRHSLPPTEAGEGWVSPVSASLTLEMESGMLKSFPPCSLKPQGAGPFSITL